MTQRKAVAYDETLKRLNIPGISDSYLFNRPAHFVGAITTDSTVDGRDLALDGVKLDNITTNVPINLDTVNLHLAMVTVTGPVNLDTLQARVNELDASVVLKGEHDFSTNLFPVSTRAGESWICSVAGTAGAVPFDVGDRVVALIDGALTTSYPGNWLKLDYTDKVSSVAGKTGIVTLLEADITDLQTYLLPTDIDTLAKLNLLVGETLVTAESNVPNIVNISNTYTLVPTDGTVRITSGTFDLTVLTAVGNDGRTFNIKNSGTGLVTILTTAGELIDDAVSGEIILAQYDNLTIQSDGVNWIIL